MDWKLIVDLVVALLIVGFLLTIAPYIFGAVVFAIVALVSSIIELFSGRDE